MEQKKIEIKVRLHHIDSGNCMEIWEVWSEKGKPRRYLSRDNGFGIHEWYTLCDAPYGYCERNTHLSENVELIICDKQWNELFRTTPDKICTPDTFPSLEERCNDEWIKALKVLPRVTREGFGEWITQQAMRPLDRTEALNWRDCDHSTIETTIISRFTWIGQEYGIFRVKQKHTKCDAEWYEYFAGPIDGKEHRYCRFFGYEYQHRHIGEQLSILGLRLMGVDNATVETRHNEFNGMIESRFMGRLVGYNLSHEQVIDVKKRMFNLVRDEYNEANAYYNKLKENECSIRGIDALLISMRKQLKPKK